MSTFGLHLANRRRGAFTLVEMVVSVALMLLVMGMASTVFKVTLEGSGKLQQLSEIDRSIRIFKNSLAREIGAIDRTRSILAIQGNPAPAYWTEEQRNADTAPPNGNCPGGDGDLLNGIACTNFTPDPERENPTMGYAPLQPDDGFDSDDGDDAQPQLPRADILMFISNLPEAKSFVDPKVSSDGPVMIVYNHAEKVTYGADGGVDSWQLISTLTRPGFQDIARDWHLARRAVLLKSSHLDDAAHVLSPTDPRGNAYVVGSMYRGVFDPSQGVSPQDGPPDPPMNVAQEEWDDLRRIAEGRVDYVSPCDPDCAGIQDFRFQYEVPDRYFGGTADEARFPVGDDHRGFERNVDDSFRGGLPAFWLMRSHLDTQPTADNAAGLSQYFLPNCASFKVEWTPNDVRLDRAGLPEVVWIDPYKPDEQGDDVPAHLSEFDVIAQVMAPEPGTALPDHTILGLGGAAPELADVQDDLVTRFKLRPDGSPDGSIDAGQLNVFDSEPETTDEVQPSFNTHVWFARDFSIQESKTLDGPDPFWPRALRITIDMFDDSGRFQTPIRHMFVLPIGSQGDVKNKLG